jgi:hypothetical protein
MQTQNQNLQNLNFYEKLSQLDQNSDLWIDFEELEKNLAIDIKTQASILNFIETVSTYNKQLTFRFSSVNYEGKNILLISIPKIEVFKPAQERASLVFSYALHELKNANINFVARLQNLKDFSAYTIRITL